MSSDPIAQGRIRQLERELRRIRILVVMILLLAVAFTLSGFRRTPNEVVRAERVELVSVQGVLEAILSADTLGFAVTLLGEQGQPAGILRLSKEPRLALETGSGREVVGLGAPRVHNLTE